MLADQLAEREQQKILDEERLEAVGMKLKAE